MQPIADMLQTVRFTPNHSPKQHRQQPIKQQLQQRWAVSVHFGLVRRTWVDWPDSVTNGGQMVFPLARGQASKVKVFWHIIYMLFMGEGGWDRATCSINMYSYSIQSDPSFDYNLIWKRTQYLRAETDRELRKAVCGHFLAVYLYFLSLCLA